MKVQTNIFRAHASLRKPFLPLLIGLLMMLMSGVLMAQPRPVLPPGPLVPGVLRGVPMPFRGPVDVRMMVIHANNDVEGYDEAIKPLERHLGFLNYRGYRLLFKNDMSLTPRNTRSLGLFDGKVIEVTLNSATEEKAVLRVRMFNPQQPDGVALDTTVSVVRKGTFFIGGPRYQKGVLLLPITAWY